MTTSPDGRVKELAEYGQQVTSLLRELKRVTNETGTPEAGCCRAVLLLLAVREFAEELAGALAVSIEAGVEDSAERAHVLSHTDALLRSHAESREDVACLARMFISRPLMRDVAERIAELPEEPASSGCH